MFSISVDAPKGCEIIYFPYWRFKGVRYSCFFTGVEYRFMDISALAVEGSFTHIPFSLGLRSQALPLKIIQGETSARFIRPMEFKTAIMEQERRARAFGKDHNPIFEDDMGETASLIYSPFYINNNRLFDGILNKSTGAVVPDDFDPKAYNMCRPEKETLFIPGLCPGCGWDLEGHFNSLVLVCRNCHTLWRAKEGRLWKVKYGSALPDNPSDLMVPFWKIEAKISSMAISSYADLVRMGNFPKKIRPEWEERPLYFWTPAFKIRPEIFLRLNTALAIVQPDPLLEEKIMGNIHLPVTLPLSEALQGIKITLASLVRPLKKYLPLLSAARVVPKEIKLVFLPFESRHHEYYHRDLNLSINKNILALSHNL